MAETLERQIEDIRGEIVRLRQELTKTRYDELRAEICKEIRKSLNAEAKGLLELQISDASNMSECAIKEHCIAHVKGAILSGLEKLSIGDAEGAFETVERLEAQIRSSKSPCLDAECTRKMLDLVKEARLLISVFDATLGSKCGSVPSENGGGLSYGDLPNTEISPSEAEDALVPLSNSRRISILRLLASHDMKFTEISTSLGLKTGHLQFHLRTLSRAGYIKIDRRTKNYSISNKGKTALSWVEGLVAALRGK